MHVAFLELTQVKIKVPTPKYYLNVGIIFNIVMMKGGSQPVSHTCKKMPKSFRCNHPSTLPIYNKMIANIK